MHQRLAVILLACTALALTDGDMETGPDLEVKLSSGATVTVGTWVHVTGEDRTFEAYLEVPRLPDNIESIYLDLRAINRAAQPHVLSMRASEVAIHACTSVPACATCLWRDLSLGAEPSRCFRHPVAPRKG